MKFIDTKSFLLVHTSSCDAYGTKNMKNVDDCCSKKRNHENMKRMNRKKDGFGKSYTE